MSARSKAMKMFRIFNNGSKNKNGMKNLYKEVVCHKCGFKQFIGFLKFTNFKLCRETLSKGSYATRIQDKKYKSRSRCLKCDAYTLLYLLN